MKKIHKKGFTLVELLIVIAILGTLAVVVLLALNPLQQLARTRDAGRTSGVTQVGHALEAYATTNNGVYPSQDVTFITTMVDAGELQSVPSPVDYTLAGTDIICNNGSLQSSLCYSLLGNDAILYSAAEADSNIRQCDGLNGASDPAIFGQAWFVYSSTAGRGGLVCGAEPTAPVDASDFIN